MKKSIQIFSFFVSFALLVGVFLPGGVVLAESGPDAGLTAISAATVPPPQAPQATISDQTPTYQWSKVAYATQYQFRVYKGTATTPLFSRTVSASVCGSSTCKSTPSVALEDASYRWQVRAYINSAWKTWSDYKTFKVASSTTGFISQFSGSMSGWQSNGVTPWAVSGTALYTQGITNYWANVYNTSAQYSDFDYSVKLKRMNSSSSNYLTVRMGTSVSPENNFISPGYIFGYSNLGMFAIARVNSDGTITTLQQWAQTCRIVKNDWNVLRVVASGNSLSFYINGVLHKTITDSTFSSGYVGISMYDRGDESDKLVVEWAKLTVPPAE